MAAVLADAGVRCEDLDVLDLQRRMLLAATRADEEGHRDWGFTESGALEEGAFAAFSDEAAALLATRNAGDARWGWKDPRTTLLLDFWEPRLPHAVFVLVYRHPWQVADSLQRLGLETFLRHPEHAYRMWELYNRRLLAFRRQHRERTLLVSCNALLRAPARFRALLADELGIGGADGALEGVLERSLFHDLPDDDPLGGLVAATHPSSAQLLRELDEEADLSSAGTWREQLPPAPVASGSRVSVVIPCFDHGELLIEAVASVERSVTIPCELIVVNDGSREPRTLEVLATLRRAGYRIVDQDNRGLATARNEGFALAQGPYVLPLDADNRLLPGFVAEAARLLDERPAVGVVYGERLELGLRSGPAHVPAFSLPTLLASNFIDACALVRKDAWSDAGGFDAAMPAPGWEDWDLWLGIVGHGWQIERLPQAGFEYRVRPGSMIDRLAGGGRREAMTHYLAKKHGELYDRHLGELLVHVQDCVRRLWQTTREREAAGRALAEVQADSHAQQVAMDAELYSWQERVRFMEGTRAWRWRSFALRLRGAVGL